MWKKKKQIVQFADSTNWYQGEKKQNTCATWK